MRLLDKTFTTCDEEYNPAGQLAEDVNKCLEELKLDSYNHLYVLRVTVDQVDTSSEDNS